MTERLDHLEMENDRLKKSQIDCFMLGLVVGFFLLAGILAAVDTLGA